MTERRVWFYFARHEGVKLARGSRILGKFLLYDFLDHFSAVSDVINLLGMGRRNHDGAILVTDDRVAGSDDYAPAIDYGIAGPRLVHMRSLPRSGRVRKNGEAIFSENCRVADRAIGD